jgi:hypothetical protein
MKLTDEKMDYADFRPWPSAYAEATKDDVPDYIKAHREVVRRERELVQLEAEMGRLVVSEAELATAGRWAGEPQPARWTPAPDEPSASVASISGPSVRSPRP